MATETIKVKGKDVRDGDILFGCTVSQARPGSRYQGLSSVWIEDNHIWIDPEEHYTVEREVKPVRFKVGTVARKNRTHIVRRENDWMDTGSLRPFWYLPGGDEYIFTGDWTIVYGGPEGA